MAFPRFFRFWKTSRKPLTSLGPPGYSWDIRIPMQYSKALIALEIMRPLTEGCGIKKCPIHENIRFNNKIVGTLLMLVCMFSGIVTDEFVIFS